MIILSHATALVLTRALRSSHASLPTGRVDPSLVTACNASEARELVSRIDSHFGPESTLHLLVLEQSRRHRVPGASVHYSSLQQSRNSFVRLSSGISMSAPELLFLQMASTLSDVKLFLLGLELCGTYSICKGREYGFEGGLPPAMNPRRLQAFLDQMGTARHARLARGIAESLSPNSASPQESRLYLKLAGGHRIGGYGVKGLVFNYKTELSAGAQKIADQKTCIIDLALPQAKVAIEYDSALIHADESRSQQDKCRRDALVHDGWDVTSVVPSTMNSPAAFDVLARSILQKGGQDARIRSEGFEERRNELFRILRMPD